MSLKTFTNWALVVVVAVLFFGAVRHADAKTSPQLLTGILAKMEKAHLNLKSLKAQIIQEKVNVQIGGSDKDFGTLMYIPAKGKDKGKLRIDYTKPQQSTIAVVGDNFVFYQPRINQVLKTTVSKASKGRTGGYAQLVGLDSSAKSLLSNFNIDIIKEEDVDGQATTQLRLTPKAGSQFASIEIWVNNQSGFPLMQKFVERNGDYTVVKLTNMQQNVALADDLFNVKYPSGTKVVDKI